MNNSYAPSLVTVPSPFNKFIKEKPNIRSPFTLPKNKKNGNYTVCLPSFIT